MRLLIDMPQPQGGLADYAHEQANALADLGCDVELLCPPRYLEGRSARYRPRPEYRDAYPRSAGKWRLVRRLRLSRCILHNMKLLSREIERGRHQSVLLHFSEYLAPLWAPRLRRLTTRGVTFGSVLHDPVRDYVVGPRSWHEWSVREAFSFLDCVFVHGRHTLPVQTSAVNVEVPHGVNTFPKPQRDRATVRAALDLPISAKVLLAAGYVRDNKNLDLVIRALESTPELYLVVAGAEQGGGNKPASFYQSLARDLGCEDRCRWIIRYLSAAERADLYNAVDLNVLTYSRSFRSASGALGAAVNYRVPSLVSSGAGSLEDTVKRYDIGLWVEPDSVESIRVGLARWIGTGLSPAWHVYLDENSWAENARRVIEALSSVRG